MLKHEIRTEIFIAAAAERVWAELVDFPAWETWNPFVISMQGEVRREAPVSLQVRTPDGRLFRFRSRLDTLAESRELSWSGGTPGVLGGRHWMRLTPVDGGVRFEHGESFAGLLVALMGAKGMNALVPAYEAMNKALKARAEAR
jgi:hypothetical protein